MSAHKFTPGPWHVEGDLICAYFNRHGNRQHVNVAAVNYIGESEDTGGTEQEANARLIAMAPDLLAVLQELRESAAYWSDYDVPVGIVERIDAAIAKATGAGA